VTVGQELYAISPLLRNLCIVVNAKEGNSKGGDKWLALVSFLGLGYQAEMNSPKRYLEFLRGGLSGGIHWRMVSTDGR
jgi:hypothetical protein